MSSVATGNAMLAARAYPKTYPFRLESAPIPEIDAGEVLVRVLSAGVSRGLLSLWVFTDMIKLLPSTLGHEIAGIVEAVGDGVEGVRVGDRAQVYAPLGCGQCESCREGRESGCSEFAMIGHALFQPDGMARYARYHEGGLAEFVRVPAANINLIAPEVSFDSACKSTTAAISLKAARTAYRSSHGAAGGTLLVTGATGASGTVAVACAQLAGFDDVVAVAARSSSLDNLSRRYSHVRATIATNDLPKGWPRNGALTAAVAAACGEPRALVDFTPVGHDVIQQALRCLARRGAAVLVAGNPSDFSVHYLDIMTRNIHLSGTDDPSRADVQELSALVATGRLNLDSLVTHRFPLDAVNDAADLVMSRKEEPVLVTIQP